jgi:hypothetical protein
LAAERYTAYFQFLENAKLPLSAVAEDLKDLRTYFACFGIAMDDCATDLRVAGFFRQDLKTVLQAVSPTVLQDLLVHLSATDGTVFQDMGVGLMAVATAPAFRSIVAQRLSSIMHEV